MSRRSVLGAGAGASAAALLAGCGVSAADTSTGGSSAKPSPAKDTSDTDKTVNWANWGAYLDKDDNSETYPTLEAFQKKYGIKATYVDEIDDNPSYYAKIVSQLKLGQDFGRDIVVFTDYMAAQIVEQGFAQKLDPAVVPNKKNILTNLANVDYDKGRNYTLTWQSGFSGIAYNIAEIEKLGLKINDIDDLWQAELKGRVEVLSELRDTVGLIMMQNGADITNFSDDDYNAGLSILENQLNSGQIRQASGQTYLDDLKSGDALATIAWSGDVFSANTEAGHEKFKFLIPKAGGTLWSDNLFIPIGSPHKKNAEVLFNYYYEPKVAAEVAAWVNYVCPVQGAEKWLAKTDPELAKSEWIFPSDKTLSKVHVFKTLTTDQTTQYTEAFQSVLGI